MSDDPYRDRQRMLAQKSMNPQKSAIEAYYDSLVPTGEQRYTSQEDTGPDHWERGWIGPIEQFPVVPKPESLCGEWLRKGSFALVHARAGNGKTALVAELIYTMKSGLRWLDMPTKPPGKVLFINGDMTDWQVQERLGYLKGMVDLWHIPFVNMAERAEDVLSVCARYDFVVFDNLGTLFYVQDMNDTSGFAPVMNLMRRITHAGATVLLITHSGKGENATAYGSSSQEWTPDSVLAIVNRKHNDLATQRSVQFQKVRGCERPFDIEMYLYKDGERLVVQKGTDPAIICVESIKLKKDNRFEY